MAIHIGGRQFMVLHLSRYEVGIDLQTVRAPGIEVLLRADDVIA
jgi:hypothetical protein